MELRKVIAGKHARKGPYCTDVDCDQDERIALTCITNCVTSCNCREIERGAGIESEFALLILIAL